MRLALRLPQTDASCFVVTFLPFPITPLWLNVGGRSSIEVQCIYYFQRNILIDMKIRACKYMYNRIENLYPFCYLLGHLGGPSLKYYFSYFEITAQIIHTKLERSFGWDVKNLKNLKTSNRQTTDRRQKILIGLHHLSLKLILCPLCFKTHPTSFLLHSLLPAAYLWHPPHLPVVLSSEVSIGSSQMIWKLKQQFRSILPVVL